jgi:tocopherol O-methyltransferase
VISRESHRALLKAGYRSEPDAAAPSLSMERVIAYYERKTAAILERYGPGPRVHFHTGFSDAPKPRATASHLRSQLCVAQERMLTAAADAWRVRSIAFRDILDVGCGLGGGAIFWAQEFGSEVTAITNVPSHVDLVATFSAQAGAGARVYPSLCDASEVPGNNRFDAIIAIDSSCHLSRRSWFRRAADLLRHGGHLFIADCFLEDPVYRAPFDQYWCARIGTVEEYLAEAREVQLTLRMCEDASQRAANFWRTTIALIRAEASQGAARRSNSAERRRSLQMHSLMRHGLLYGGLQYALMSFVKS